MDIELSEMKALIDSLSGAMQEPSKESLSQRDVE